MQAVNKKKLRTDPVMLCAEPMYWRALAIPVLQEEVVRNHSDGRNQPQKPNQILATVNK